MRAALVGALVLCGSTALAQTPAEEPVQVVAVDGIKNPEMRSYRSIRAAFEEFDEHHGMAPNAELRFRMKPRSSAARAAMDGLALRIVGEGEPIQIAIAPDGLFFLPRLPEGHDADTDLILNRKSGMYHGRPDVRSASLPDNVRRLGDLRLECRVTMAMVKTEMPFYARALVNTVLMTTDWCSKKDIKFGYDTGVALASATLKYGDRTMPAELRTTSYEVVIGDTSWPDDALIELTYK